MNEWSELPFWGSKTWDKLRTEIINDPSTTPMKEHIFRALELTPKEQVRVVILGQDPYHTKGVANGLAFGVSKEASRLPPSLTNIFRELVDNTGCPYPTHGDLSCWAKQGVLLLNTCLTTRVGQARAHSSLGWEQLASQVLESLRDVDVVYVLWGKDAQTLYHDSIGPITGGSVVYSSHPSPYSAHLGFFGSKPFTRVNEHLINWNKEPIQWTLTP